MKIFFKRFSVLPPRTDSWAAHIYHVQKIMIARFLYPTNAPNVL